MRNNQGFHQLQPGERWFAVQTLLHREEGAEVQLGSQGFLTFLPRIRKTCYHARRLKTILEPPFPRYLFIILNLQRDQWRSVNGTYGVARLVMEAGRPLPVRPGVVESLLALSDDTQCVHFDWGSKLKPGRQVLIQKGPLVDKIALIEHLDAKGRAALLLELMGQPVRVHAQTSSLRPLE